MARKQKAAKPENEAPIDDGKIGSSPVRLPNDIVEMGERLTAGKASKLFAEILRPLITERYMKWYIEEGVKLGLAPNSRKE